MNTTAATQTIRLIAARVNMRDLLSVDGEDFRTVDTIALTSGRVVVEFTNGEVANLSPLRYVEIAA